MNKRMYHLLLTGLLLFSFWSLHAASICVVICDEFRGEREFAERIRIACEKLHWKVEISDHASPPSSLCDYDWILTLVPRRNNDLVENNYLVLFDPEHHYFDAMGFLDEKYLGYAGYLSTYEKRDLLLQDVLQNNKRLYPDPWYPTVQYRPYREVIPSHLFFFVGHWGNRHSNTRYQILQRNLAKKKYSRFFGDPYFGKIYRAAFQGSIPYDGETVIKRIAEAGVCLVLHSETHLKHAIPSGRIFEAAAASAVIISDQNPFVMNNFGDAVFYVDQELSGEQMFAQIDAHMSWIQNHPQEALEMAKRAHQIFEEKFLLEDQLLKFDHFHRSLRTQ